LSHFGFLASEAVVIVTASKLIRTIDVAIPIYWGTDGGKVHPAVGCKWLSSTIQPDIAVLRRQTAVDLLTAMKQRITFLKKGDRTL
jgi:hypothetical protein